MFLRRDKPGKVIQKNDVDGRIKTIFDALKMPIQEQDRGGYKNPDADEKPFYCLLEDDTLVTSVSVETDLLLEPISGQQYPSRSDARLVITVSLRPSRLTWANMGFV